VALDERYEFGRVFFPSQQIQYNLALGVMALLDCHGLAFHYGKVR
tara:strand:+ start:851 stop:985 length:135 start_codon:yes stop_codon:yes gene_type:complete